MNKDSMARLVEASAAEAMAANGMWEAAQAHANDQDNMEADNMEAMEAAGPSVTEKPTNGSVHLDLDLEDDDLNQPPEVPRESTFTLEHVIRRGNIMASATSKTKKCSMPKSHMLYFLLNKRVYASEMATPTGTNGVAKNNIPVAARPLAEGHIFRLSSLSLSKRSLQQQRMFVH
ncbi:hypothetical protein Tco_0963582, partial [Tanacetum coccineum]